MAEKIARIFRNIVLFNADEAGKSWFEKVSNISMETWDKNSFMVAISGAIRTLGILPAKVSSGQSKALEAAGAPFAPVDWELAEVGRGALILTAILFLPDKEHENLLFELYYKGDNREKQAVLKILVFLPRPERFKQLAVDSCRNHVQTVFESLACQNPFPALYFDDNQFNQLVLKALFTGAPLNGIVGWKERNNRELVRMAKDYADERKAAGRQASFDIQQIIDHPGSKK